VVTEDGEPAIRVSGQVMGGVSTRREFGNYVLRLEFKWGTKKWPPRENSVRDSGVLYHCVGEPAPATGWMQSAECQIEEQDCGDFWAVQGVKADTDVIRMDTTEAQRKQLSRLHLASPARHTYLYHLATDPIVLRDQAM